MYYDIKKELDVARIQAMMQNSQGSNGSNNPNESRDSEHMPLEVYRGIQDQYNHEESELRTLLEQFKEATAAQQAQLSMYPEAQIEQKEL